ncbi:MAG: leucine-rich repeat domain-containing protein [Spirochaetes bacterium]|nr:leucine-rich repeat domain-containing protein [Spirochaetota bacterium]
MAFVLSVVSAAVFSSCENPVMQRLLADLNPPVAPPPPAPPGPTPGHYFVLNQINPVAPNIATIIAFNPSASFYGRLEIPAVIDGRVVTQIAGVAAGQMMFQNMGLTSVVIPNSVTTIGAASFANNNISSLTLGSGVRLIAASAFNNNLLQSVVIPNNVETIVGAAFMNNQLTSISIGGMVTINDTPAAPAFNLGFAEVYRAAVFDPWWQRARFVRPAYPPDNTNWSRAE